MIPILVAICGRRTTAVYGAHKLWKAARRAGHDIGRDQVARLMRDAGHRGRAPRQAGPHHQARSDGAAARRIWCKRDFTATAPNQLWVTDLTYVPTWAGVAYVCFIVDAFSRMIVGWRVASHMRTDDGPRRARDGPLVTRHHDSPDCGVTPTPASQFTSHPLRRTPRRDRRAALDRHRRRQLRQRARRDGERALQDRADPRARPRPVEDRRGRRARHARLGALAQHRTPPRLPRRRAPDRVRNRSLRCATRPTSALVEIQ